MADKFAGGIKSGSTSVSIPVILRKAADSTELTGIAFGSVTATYRRQGAASVAITTASLALVTTAWTQGGWIEADATNQPGSYRLDVPDAAFAAGVEWVIVAVKVATGFVFYERFNLESKGAAEVAAVLPAVAAGAAGGLHINGANVGPLSVSGGVTFSNTAGDALVLTSSGSNGSGLNASGNGTADGIKATGGATGRGIHALGGATSGAGIRCEATGGNSLGIHGLGFGSGPGMRFEGGATGSGALFVGGSTSGDGIDVTTTAGDGISLTPTAGHAFTATANGTSKHGLNITGGTAGVSDGVHAAAGTGGVDVRGNITGNLAGNVTGTVATATNLTNLPTIPTDWLGAAGISAAAVTKIQAGLATPTNITAATGIVLAAATHTGAVIPTVTTTGTATNLTNLPAAPTDWITALAVSAGAVTKVQAGLATPTNITGGVITTVTTLTNLPTIPTDWLGAAGVSAGAVTKMQAGLATPTNITAGTIAAVSGNVGGNVAGSVGSVANLSGVALSGGTVSVATSTTQFTATGSGLNATAGGYTTAPMSIFWQTGANAGFKYPITGHTIPSTGNHAFTITGPMANAPSIGDTFVIG